MRRSEPAQGNPFGIAEALIGLAAGFLLSILALSAYDSAAHVSGSTTTTGGTVLSLVCLWIGFVGAAVVASRLRVRDEAVPGSETALVRRG
ncbi:MAG TPA: hypothetical protein VFN50_03805, partial [Acidimicrobiales bacterium]|nr:hypothetical protein [Acidimicrobiales bacterium]